MRPDASIQPANPRDPSLKFAASWRRQAAGTIPNVTWSAFAFVTSNSSIVHACATGLPIMAAVLITGRSQFPFAEEHSPHP